MEKYYKESNGAIAVCSDCSKNKLCVSSGAGTGKTVLPGKYKKLKNDCFHPCLAKNRNFDRNRLRGTVPSRSGIFYQKYCDKMEVIYCNIPSSMRPLQFPQGSLVAVVLRYRLGFRISQPIISCMLMRYLQKSACCSYCKCVLRNDEAFFTTYYFCILKQLDGMLQQMSSLKSYTYQKSRFIHRLLFLPTQ